MLDNVKIEVQNKEEVEKKKKIRKSWKPASLLEVPQKYRDPNFTYYWASKRDARIDKKLAEGWEVDTKIAPAMRKDGALSDFRPTLNDGQQMGNTLERRELILVRLPNEYAEARREYYNEKSSSLLETKTREDHNALGKSGYGKGLEVE